MEKIVIYGKGGIGKSTIASNLSAICAQQGKKVLHVGCDPKHDSTIRLLKGRKIPTVIEVSQNSRVPEKEEFVFKGIYGIDCIECGGPKAGVGCAGRGVTRMFEILEEREILESKDYDIVIFDVLGDVVCGGFAAPLKRGFGEKVFIVISEEIMSMYAANKIAQAINQYEFNDVYLGGVIVNFRNNDAESEHVTRFVKKLNSKILGVVPRSKKILDAERDHKTVVEAYPNSDIVKIFSALYEKISQVNKTTAKKPCLIDEGKFNNLFAK